MQQGLLEFVEGGEFAGVEGFEALGFGRKGVEAGYDGLLFLYWWNRQYCSFNQITADALFLWISAHTKNTS